MNIRRHGLSGVHRAELRSPNHIKRRAPETRPDLMVRMRGLEPPRCHHHGLLRPARLPVPPHPRDSSNIRTRSRGVNSLPEPNSYARSIVTSGPIIPVITIIITISRVGPGVRVP